LTNRKTLILVAAFILLFAVLALSQGGYRGLSVVVDRIEMISESSIDQLLGKCIKYRVDTLYIPVVSFMEALYDSDILPRSNVLINNGTPSGFDPLAYVMEKGETFGIQIIPLIDPVTVWPSKDLPMNALHVSNRHPDWLSRDSMGRLLTDPIILDPGAPAVQRFIISLVSEILRDYKPYQIAFANFEYPSPEYGHNPYALKEFEQPRTANRNRIVNLDTFRKETLDDLIKRLRATIESLGLSTRIFMFSLSQRDNALERHFQDWVYWINTGYVDWSVIWYWQPDRKNVAHDTQWALEHVLQEKVIPGFSPQSLQPSQYGVVLNTILSFPVSGVVVDTFQPGVLRILNDNKVGIPR